tara:strand:+ start:2984 stop:3187 length:204 start_codon:yes stop_codon:yes gene_type:complete
MKIKLQERSKELEGLREQNSEQLEKNKATLEKLNVEIQQGSLREIAFSNRIDEIENIVKELLDQKTE